MGVFAVCIDLTQVFFDVILIGVILNRLIDVFVLAGFWMAFKSQGVSFTKTRAFVFFGFALLEMFPGVDAFPLWTADVIAVMAMTTAEDKIEALGGKKGLRKDFDKKGAKGIAKNDSRLGDLKNASSGIMNKLQATRNMPKPVMSRGAARERQKYDTELDRGSKIAAQRNQKQNANQNENQVAV